MITSRIGKITPLYALWVLLVTLCVGCSSGSNDPPYVRPPAPAASQYAVVTPNYINRYSEPLGYPPFPVSWQFASQHFPIAISYVLSAVPPTDFDVPLETENAVRCWNLAEPRACAVSRAVPAEARIHVVLVSDIVHNGQTNIIGLTTVEERNTPSFLVEIATRYKNSHTTPPQYEQLTPAEIKKTILHELGHALGLGHSPERNDLMYYQANEDQGTTYGNFLTFGDAITLWSTFNARSISWQRFPAVTLATSESLQQPSVRSAPSRGETVVDIYTKE